jgi:DNA-binding transcriptional MocR family regulator
VTMIIGQTASQIAKSIEDVVSSGRLGPGDLLPPVRQLAQELGVNRNTVANAYQHLARTGFVYSDGRRGTIVASGMPSPARFVSEIPSELRDLSVSNPEIGLLPDIRSILRRFEPVPALYGDIGHLPELVECTSELFRKDGLPAGEVIVAGGALEAISLALTGYLAPGDKVALEDPAFSNCLQLCRTLGYAVVPLSQDDQGILPGSLKEALSKGIRAIITTPRAQNPTGAAMSPQRASELALIVNGSPDLLVIEDDHFSMLTGAEPVTMCTPRTKHWAIVRSVSKFFGPDMRVAFVLGSSKTTKNIERQQQLGPRWVSKILQRLVFELLQDVGAMKTVAAARASYDRRRPALVNALARHGLMAVGQTGLNVWLPVDHEQRIAARLYERGWAVLTSESFRITPMSAIRFSIGGLHDELIERLAADTAEAINAPPSRMTV